MTRGPRPVWIAGLLLISTAGILLTRGTPLMWTPINDITTDTLDPPGFEALIPLRPEGSNPVEYGGAAVARRQAELYPDIRTIRSTSGATEAFRRALETAEGMGWDVVAGDNVRGVIEAIDTTRFLRFKDDVVVRVRSTVQGSLIDIRSRSRVGRSDFGKNAARVREFTRRFAG